MAKAKYCLIVLFMVSLFFLFPSCGRALETVNLYLFYSSSCPHCAAEKVFLKELEEKYENLHIELLEITKNESNAALLDEVKSALGTINTYVPYTVIEKTGLTGYNENIAGQIEHFIQKYSNTKTIDVVSSIRNGEDVRQILEEEKNLSLEEEQAPITVPIFGKINPKQVSIPVLALVMGAIDGFNPCAMWVLLFLISMLIGMKDRKKMWILGLTFLITSALIYLLFMVSWLKIAVSFSTIGWVQKGIALIALLAGLWNLYSFYQSKNTGCLVVKEEKRQKTLTKIKKITSEKKFVLALFGVITLAISVNIVELACSAGLPLLFTQVLALNQLSSWQYAINIFIYILFFLLDDLIIFFLAMMTMKVSGISNKYAKYSHLIGGMIMLLIGVLLLVKPEWIMLQFS